MTVNESQKAVPKMQEGWNLAPGLRTGIIMADGIGLRECCSPDKLCFIMK